jgi:transposase-like protein
MIRVGAPQMKRNRHSTEFREQALSKVRHRGSRTVEDVARELNMSLGTLWKWLASAKLVDSTEAPQAELPAEVPAQSWSPAQRLLALQETHPLSGPELHVWCRERGLFEHQLKAWRAAFCAPPVPESRESKSALRELQVKHDGLQRELRRKERALAEAAALLVLQKKYQALWEDEEK